MDGVEVIVGKGVEAGAVIDFAVSVGAALGDFCRGLAVVGRLQAMAAATRAMIAGIMKLRFMAFSFPLPPLSTFLEPDTSVLYGDMVLRIRW